MSSDGNETGVRNPLYCPQIINGHEIVWWWFILKFQGKKKCLKPRLATLLFSEVQLISYARLKSVTGSQSLLPFLGYSRTQLFWDCKQHPLCTPCSLQQGSMKKAPLMLYSDPCHLWSYLLMTFGDAVVCWALYGSYIMCLGICLC